MEVTGLAAKFARFAKGQAFGAAVLACAALAFAFPSAFREWGGVKLTAMVVPAIQLIMFGMGTTLSLGDFLRVAKSPWAVAVGVVLQFLVMPLVGFALAHAFGFTGELAAGCVLVGAVAGGTASNVVAYLAGADVALSVTMTCCSTLLSPFLTPLFMKLLAGRFVEIAGNVALEARNHAFEQGFEVRAFGLCERTHGGDDRLAMVSVATGGGVEHGIVLLVGGHFLRRAGPYGLKLVKRHDEILDWR